MTEKKNEFSWWPEHTEGDWGQKRSWPAEVPVLEAKNMRKDILGTGDCRCLLGWSGGFPNGPIRQRVDDMILTVIAEKTGEAQDIDEFNDFFSTRKKCADVYNESMRRLGFTEAV